MKYILELLELHVHNVDLYAYNSINVTTSFHTYYGKTKCNIKKDRICEYFQVLALINRRSPKGSHFYHKRALSNLESFIFLKANYFNATNFESL